SGPGRRQAPPDRNSWLVAQSGAAAGRLSVPSPLPDGDRGLTPGDPAARDQSAGPGSGLHPRRIRAGAGMSDTPALELKQLTKRFGDFIAVNRVDLAVPRNQVVALVGESGSGKTTTGLLALRLLAHDGGQILLDGEDISTLSQKQMKAYRRRLQVVFQDSYSSLDPMMTLGEIVAEPLGIHGVATAAERRDTARGWLEKVGLDGSYANRYPHELSGGQRQRVSVARALILGASVLVADEPTSALDVSVKAQIVNLLQGLQADMGLSMLFISHDLSVVRSL